MVKQITLIALLIFVTSCRPIGQEWEVLTHAEALTEAEPDSAYTLLDSIDSSGLSREFKARLNLAKANCIYYSNMLTAESDTNLSEAIEYFKRRGDKKRLARSYFLRANQKATNDELSSAIVDLLKGEEMAIETKDSVNLGLIYRAMFENYEILDDQASALGYMKKSYDIFNSLQSERYLSWAMYDYARALSNALRYSEAISVLQECYYRTKKDGNQYLSNQIILLLGDVNNYIGDYKRACEYYKDYELTSLNESANHRYWMNYGRSLVELGRIDKAIIMQDSLSKYYPDECYLSLLLASKQGDKDKIIAYQHELVKEQNDAFRALYSRNFAGIIDGYYKEQQEAAAAREQRDHTAIVAVVVIVILLLIILAINVRIRHAERSESQTALKQLEESLRVSEIQRQEFEESAERKLEDMRKQLNGMLQERISEAERFCRDLGEAPESKRELKIYTRVRQAMNEFAPGSVYLKSTEKILDSTLDGLMTDFRRDYPGMKEHDYALFVYLVLGLSSQVCTALLDTKITNFYNKKSRLRSRIASQPDVAEKYLKYVV